MVSTPTITSVKPYGATLATSSSRDGEPGLPVALPLLDLRPISVTSVVSAAPALLVRQYCVKPQSSSGGR